MSISFPLLTGLATPRRRSAAAWPRQVAGAVSGEKLNGRPASRDVVAFPLVRRMEQDLFVAYSLTRSLLVSLGLTNKRNSPNIRVGQKCRNGATTVAFGIKFLTL